MCGATPAAGFRLAGVAVDEVASEQEAALRLSSWSEEAEACVVLIEEELYSSLPAEVVAAIERRGHPILVPFPGPSWAAPAPAEERVIEILRRAIGYRVHL